MTNWEGRDRKERDRKQRDRRSATERGATEKSAASFSVAPFSVALLSVPFLPVALFTRYPDRPWHLALRAQESRIPQFTRERPRRFGASGPALTYRDVKDSLRPRCVR